MLIVLQKLEDFWCKVVTETLLGHQSWDSCRAASLWLNLSRGEKENRSCKAWRKTADLIWGNNRWKMKNRNQSCGQFITEELPLNVWKKSELVLQGQVDEEQSEWSGWSAGAGGGKGLLPACASFIFLIKAGAVGAVKKQPRDMGIGDGARASHKKRRRKQPEELPCQTFTLNLTHLPRGPRWRPVIWASTAALERFQLLLGGWGGFYGWVAPKYTIFLSEMYRRGEGGWDEASWLTVEEGKQLLRKEVILNKEADPDVVTRRSLESFQRWWVSLRIKNVYSFLHLFLNFVSVGSLLKLQLSPKASSTSALIDSSQTSVLLMPPVLMNLHPWCQRLICELMSRWIVPPLFILLFLTELQFSTSPQSSLSELRPHVKHTV